MSKRRRRSHNMQGQSHSHWKAQRAGQIQNTTHSKSRQLATKVTNKELQEISPKGQQCLRPPLYRRSDQVDACGLWVPSQINMAQGCKGRKLHWWPLLTEQNVNKYYPEITETPKGHMNQTQKNVRSTKAKPTTWEQPTQSPLEETNTSQLTRPIFPRDPNEPANT